MRKILYVILSFVVAVSCNKDSEQDWGGMEYMEFEITGKVVDGDAAPIKGVLVSTMGVSVQTGADGKYKLRGQGGSQTSMTLSFVDVDGIENGGLHYAVTKTVQLDYIEGKHGPFLGLYGKSGVDVTLSMGLPTVPDFDTPIQ